MDFRCKYCGMIVDLYDAYTDDWIGRAKNDDTGYQCNVNRGGSCYPDAPKEILEAYRKAIIDYHEKREKLLEPITIEYNQKMKEIEEKLKDYQRRVKENAK